MFRALPAPTDEDVLEVARRTAQRVVAILSKHGRSLSGLGDEAERATERDPALASCVGAAARTPALRVADRSRARDNERVAVVMGTLPGTLALEVIASRPVTTQNIDTRP